MQNESKLKATGLVEVLVVLAIVGLTMVGAMQLTTEAFNSIRDNETTDLATGFLIQGLEIAKSPQRIVLTNDVGLITRIEGSYRIDTSVDPPVLFKVDDISIDLIGSCLSVYVVEITQSIVGGKPDICVQITIEEITSTNYEIKSHVIYPTREGPVIRTLSGFRSGDFNI